MCTWPIPATMWSGRFPRKASSPISPEPARRALVSLGLLPAPVFTFSQAAAVLGAEEAAGGPVLERLLEYLLEASVITVAGVRTETQTVLYEIPVLVYAYAREIATSRP